MCSEVKMGEITCTLRVRLRRERSFWGPGVANILREIETGNSLRAAAQKMHMSYSKAWRVVHAAEVELGFSLIETYNGGNHGGGSMITAEGKKLLEAYDTVVRAVDAQLQKEFNTHLFPLFSMNKDEGET